MSATEYLPRRPLERGELRALASHDQLDVVPYGGVRDGTALEIYALKIATDHDAHALGFEVSTEEWRQLSTVETTDLAEADEQLDPVLDGWILDRYGDRFDVLKTV